MGPTLDCRGELLCSRVDVPVEDHVNKALDNSSDLQRPVAFPSHPATNPSIDLDLRLLPPGGLPRLLADMQ